MATFKTLEYKKLNDSQSISLDVYFPPLPARNEVVSVPVVVFFHGGALLIGNKQTLVPTWLIERSFSLGYAFISADYRFLIPHTAHDIVEDIQDLFKFISTTEFKGDDYTFTLDQDRIAVTGGSAGGLCAHLAAIYCNPKPKVIVSIYGMGGDFFYTHHLSVKKDGYMFMNEPNEVLDPALFSSITYPYSQGLPRTVIDDPFQMISAEELPAVIAANPRMLVFRLFHQLGNYLDYYTGLHEPSISDTLRAILDKEGSTVEDFKKALPEDKHKLFPQLCVDASWPPTIIIHGVPDDVVPIHESRHFRDIATKAGIPFELIEVEGGSHGFDGYPGAEENHKADFNRVIAFIKKYL